MSAAIRIHLLRNNKDDTITIYPHDRRTDAVVVKHRYSENLETDTLTVVRKDELVIYFNTLFDYVFSVIRMKATDSYRRIGISVPGLPHFDQEITADVHLGELRETIEAMTDFTLTYLQTVAVPRADGPTQPPVVARADGRAQPRNNGAAKKGEEASAVAASAAIATAAEETA
jgi:hypothetical protein